MKKLLCVTGAALALAIPFSSFSIAAEAKEKTVTLTGQVYEFDSKNKYEIDSSSPSASADHSSFLGTWSLSGDISKEYTKDGCAAYEIAGDTVFSLSFSYSSKWKDAGAMDWHLTDDDAKTVNGIDLDEKIKSGAVILQTSFDGSKWVTVKSKTGISSDTAFDRDNGINDIQLVNGCYYRVIVAYELERQLTDTHVWFVNTSDYEYKRYAEVYQFFAGYKQVDQGNSGKKNFFTTFDYTKSTDKHTYVGSDQISSGDPHYGWELGEFCLSGYTDKGDSSDVYQKSVGNRIRLTYNLKQDINCLNGDSQLIIERDKKGGDGEFQTKAHDMGRGELIVKHTDEEGKVRITEYSNYLEALASPGANTTISLFEEGDYVVHLDYAITNQKGIDKTTYYRMSFTFKIRNSNCMVYIFDSVTGAELSNGDVTANGFRIDTAKSSYPKLTVKKQILNDTKTGLNEDTRFNRAAADGEIFSEDGIYTVTAHNRYDSTREPSVKTIYVGNDSLLKAYTKHLNTPQPYTIAELTQMKNDGYTITDQGDLIAPVSETTSSSEISETTTSTSEETTVSTSTSVSETTEETKPETTAELEPAQSSSGSALPYVGGGVGLAAVGSAAAFYFKKKKK